MAGVERAGEPEAEDLHDLLLAIGHHQQVRRVEVAMDHAAAVEVRDGGGELGAQVDRPAEGEAVARRAVKDPVERLADGERHGQVHAAARDRAEVFDVDDVWVAQPVERARLAPEARREDGIAGLVGRQHLDHEPPP
jgi:hypothetical protein